MKNTLEYKGYLTRIEYSVEDRVLYGKIEGIKDLVNFESDSVDQIEHEFHCAVDDYLQMCEDLGETPDKAYSGTFNVRISPALHRKIAMQAFKMGETLNSTVERAIEAYTNDAPGQPAEELWQTAPTYSGNVPNVGRATSNPLGYGKCNAGSGMINYA
ncbi:MAG: type II toxin-antitoxin system HicB family antitoxin [Candidatus Faecousia sp.]|nr:type II toxin-antitoxin system HicB family antitoxin [Clostridiales bacterium]MDD7651169.1 type II toxin-antitoxin system HicB family antitoxin [Bacillota bacterium]MDY4218930.1 type II toxin-antitoxin system HicB family antitoxin [Candidatus Faecousia sp.]